MINFNEISKYRENNRIEAKRSTGGFPRSLWETYSAFANTIGGILLLGVEELPDKSFRTVALPDPEQLVKSLWDGLDRDRTANVNILRRDDVQIVPADGNRIVVIEVPRADRQDRPVYIGADPYSGSYRRNGEGDYHCSKDEVENMLRDQAEVSQDMRVLEQKGLEVLDSDSIARYRRRLSGHRPGRRWESLPEDEFLRKLGATGRGKDGVMHPTAAGLLMFGRLSAIVGEFPDYRLDYKDISGRSTSSYDGSAAGPDNWSQNLFDFYFRVLDRLSEDICADLPAGRTQAVSVQKALGEALANAVLHANYYDKCGLTIERGRDAVILTNPGGLRMDMADAVGGGISDPRNAGLTKMFNLIRVGKHSGSGLSVIREIWKQQGFTAPRLEERFNPDRTVLSLGLGSKEQKKAYGQEEGIKRSVIECLTDHVACRIPEIAAYTGLKPSHARECLEELTSEDLVVAEGSGRNRIYRLKA